MDKLIDGMLIALILTLILAGFGWVGKQESDMAAADDRHYCDMTAIYKNSNGNQGWPEFRKGEISCSHKNM